MPVDLAQNATKPT